MSRKRDKPYFSRNAPISKRRRPHPSPHLFSGTDGKHNNNHPPAAAAVKPPPPPPVVVMGLSPDCSVLDLKSRFEIYGPISRIRIDRTGVGSVSFRSKDAAEDAIAAALDPSFGITVDSRKVQVLWATDPLAQWREGVGVGRNKDNGNSTSSKLLRAETLLSRHGRGRGGNNNRLASAIVISPNASSDIIGADGGSDGEPTFDAPFKGREIVAYNDIL